MELDSRITESEWEVMESLWSHGPATSSEVTRWLHPALEWSESTVKTLLSRLAAKGVVGHEKRGRGYLYSPMASREDCQRAEREVFSRRVYRGSVGHTIAAFLADADLDDDQIAELRHLIDEKNRQSENRR